MANKNFKVRQGLEAPLIAADDGTTAITISNTTGNIALAGTLDVQGGTITESTGALTISTGAGNGDITLDPNGSGDIVLTLADGGNLTNSRNYVLGAVRNATTESNGDAWSFISGTGTGHRGISIDNSANTAKATGAILRSFTGGAVAGAGTTNTITLERARGTAAAPTAIQSSDSLGRIVATGANGANTFIGDSVSASPATINFLAAENFSGTTNVGTQITVALMPTAKTLTAVTTPTVVLNITPQATISRSDSFTWQTGNTTAVPGSTTTLALDVSGNLTVTGDLTVTGNDIKSSGGTTALTLNGADVAIAGDLTVTGNDIKASGGTTALTLSGANVTVAGTVATSGGTFDNDLAVDAQSNLLDTNTTAGTSLAIQTNYWTSSAKTTRTLPQSGNKLGNFRFNSYRDTAGLFALGAQVSAEATENWTLTANGSKISLLAIKQGTTYLTGQVAVIDASPEFANISSNTITLENNAGTDYAVLNSTSAKFATPVRTTITSATVAKGGTFTPAVTAMNSIILEITAGSGTTTIDVSNLTVAGENAVFDIMVYNNSGGSINANALLIINSGNTALDHGATITNGTRAMFQVNCVDIYANALYLGNAV